MPSRKPLLPSADRLTNEMKVTFDTAEMMSFFDSFAPLELPCSATVSSALEHRAV
jgi:hypothetical protein